MPRVLAICVVLACAPAFARSCPVPLGGSEALGSVDSSTRVAALAGWLPHDRDSARLWNWSWVIINAALTVGQGVAAPFFKMPERADWVTGAIGTAVATVGYWLFALDVPAVGSLPETDPDCEVLAQVEAKAKTGAESEDFNTSIWSHLITVVLSIVPGLVLGLAYKRWPQGVVLTLGGVALGELAIATTPTGLSELWSAYLRGEPPSNWVPGWKVSSLGLAPVMRDQRAAGVQLTLSGAF